MVVTELHGVALAALRRHCGRPAAGGTRALEDAIRVAHGLTEREV